MTKYPAISALVLATAASLSASAFAGENHHRHHHYSHYRVVEQERYVPAHEDLIDMLFAGPRYYDQQMSATAAGACAYHRVGPDANAVNDINDNYCGK
ncbi:hypothetical protein AB6802_28590 [Mesorhizobium sp. RCC_202]|uniref:hypothetical protein n=1 Tax=Mesorhizobium sp. RCC_202 TaxID=3239222 RepID=UPI0035266B67